MNNRSIPIMFWNIRGLGQPDKCAEVKRVLGLHSPKIVCLHESKLDHISFFKSLTFLPPPSSPLPISPWLGRPVVSLLLGAATATPFLNNVWVLSRSLLGSRPPPPTFPLLSQTSMVLATITSSQSFLTSLLIWPPLSLALGLSLVIIT